MPAGESRRVELLTRDQLAARPDLDDDETAVVVLPEWDAELAVRCDHCGSSAIEHVQVNDRGRDTWANRCKNCGRVSEYCPTPEEIARAKAEILRGEIDPLDSRSRAETAAARLNGGTPGQARRCPSCRHRVYGQCLACKLRHDRACGRIAKPASYADKTLQRPIATLPIERRIIEACERHDCIYVGDLVTRYTRRDVANWPNIGPKYVASLTQAIERLGVAW